MALKSRRTGYKKLKRSRNQLNRRRSRRSQLRGGSKPVWILYAKGREEPDKYEIILVADNINDLKLLANDVPENMVSPFKDVIHDNMFVQFQFTDVKPDKITLRQLPSGPKKAEGQRISSQDKSTLFYTYSPNGLVRLIYTNPEDLVRDDPGADIKTIKKNNFDWNMPIFGA